MLMKKDYFSNSDFVISDICMLRKAFYFIGICILYDFKSKKKLREFRNGDWGGIIYMVHVEAQVLSIL